jgi:hypothetical protein
MKKVLLMMVLILPMVFQSCKEDDDDEISLPGTEWIYELTISGYKMETHLKFPDESHFQMLYYQDGTQSDSPSEGTYSLSGSEITLLYEDGDTDKGNIKGNKITFINPEMPSMQAVFTKK